MFPYLALTLRSLLEVYRYLGKWDKRERNRPVETEILRNNLVARGYSSVHISAALERLQTAADTTGVTPYQANLRTYQLLRYGVEVAIAAGRPHETVHLVDWEHPEANDFALAEEVTLRGGYDRRPDLVLYVNGIAMAVIELKRSSVEVTDGIRQLITNQEEIFNKEFFSTVQFLFAGSDSQGLRYGTVTSREEFFVEWKAAAVAGPPATGALLDRPLAEMCDKARLLDLVRNCILFDNGIKEGAASAPVCGSESRAGAHKEARRRGDLAYAGQRQEHPDGDAGQVAAGA